MGAAIDGADRNVDISLGALSESEDDVSQAVAVPVEEARVHASAQPSKNIDATGWRQAGQARTLWTIATPLVTVFGIVADASRAGLRGLLASVQGILISVAIGDGKVGTMTGRLLKQWSENGGVDIVRQIQNWNKASGYPSIDAPSPYRFKK